jgi:hypothetical protein
VRAFARETARCGDPVVLRALVRVTERIVRLIHADAPPASRRCPRGVEGAAIQRPSAVSAVAKPKSLLRNRLHRRRKSRSCAVLRRFCAVRFVVCAVRLPSRSGRAVCGD